MARFFLLVFAAFSFLPSLAFAVSCSDSGYACVDPYWVDNTGASTHYTSHSAAAAAAVAYRQTHGYPSEVLYGLSEVAAHYAVYTTKSGSVSVSAGCDTGSLFWTGSASQCRVTSGQKCQVGGDLGSPSTYWSYSGEYPGYGGYCMGGCSYALYGYEGYDAKSGKSLAKGTMKPTGSTCTTASDVVTNDSKVNTQVPSTSPGASSPDPSSCVNGGVPYTGTVMGKTVTVCGSPTKSSTTDTTSTSNSGSTTTNSGGTQSTTNSTATGSTSKTTTCSNGQCTTTTNTTTTTGGGSGTSGGTSTTGTETKTQPQADYCKDNPNQPICKDTNSSFGGTCGAFTCDGDAVQCAMAREQHQRNCALFDIKTPISEAGDRAAVGGDRPSDHPGANPDFIDIGGRMNGVGRVNPYGDGCPRDIDLNVMGNTVAIPLSGACDLLKLLGEIAIGFAYIAGARIVMSGVSSGNSQ